MYLSTKYSCPALVCILGFLGKCVTNVIYHKHFPFSDLMCPARRCFSQKLIHFILFSLRERKREKYLVKRLVGVVILLIFWAYIRKYWNGTNETGFLQWNGCKKHTDLLNYPTACMLYATHLVSMLHPEPAWIHPSGVLKYTSSSLPLSSCVKFMKQQI